MHDTQVSPDSTRDLWSSGPSKAKRGSACVCCVRTHHKSALAGVQKRVRERQRASERACGRVKEIDTEGEKERECVRL